MTEAVLVHRAGAMGDVIMTTPVVARLRRRLGPDAIIAISTRFPEVYFDNPDINQVNKPAPPGGYTRIIDLDDAYEKRPHLHAIDAYMMEAFSDADWPAKDAVLHRAPLGALPALPWERAVVIHAGANGALSRTFPRAFWDEVIDALLLTGATPVIVGAGADLGWPGRGGVVDLVDRLTLHQVAGVIQHSRCFISGDTGLSHVAGATDTPMVTIYTQVLATRRMPWRKGALGLNVTPLAPDLDCVGCLTTPWTPTACKRGDFACVGERMVKPHRVLQAVLAITGALGPREAELERRLAALAEALPAPVLRTPPKPATLLGRLNERRRAIRKSIKRLLPGKRRRPRPAWEKLG
ncbi:MAG: glycosyltransferase family 9 protein [Caulobacteraceae bacterium]|nr:glycosyltransferase family 9 protein [Caulobacteraceae bacterium]